MFIYTQSDNNERLTDLLRLLDWSKGFKVSSSRKKFRSAVDTVIEELQLEKEYDRERVLYFLPWSEAQNLDVTRPDGFTLKPITTLEQIERVSSIWSNRDEGSLFFLKRLMDWNLNIGLFTAEDELVSWCFRLQSGPLGALQTDERYLRRGFGSLVTRKMCKMLAELGQDTFALVDTGNEPSRRMFEKIGFKATDHTFKIRTKSLVPFKWED